MVWKLRYFKLTESGTNDGYHRLGEWRNGEVVGRRNNISFIRVPEVYQVAWCPQATKLHRMPRQPWGLTVTTALGIGEGKIKGSGSNTAKQ